MPFGPIFFIGFSNIKEGQQGANKRKNIKDQRNTQGKNGQNGMQCKAELRIFRIGKRNSTDDVTYSSIKYEWPPCKRLLVAYNNGL